PGHTSASMPNSTATAPRQANIHHDREIISMTAAPPEGPPLRVYALAWRFSSVSLRPNAPLATSTRGIPRSLSSSFARSTRRLSRRRLGALALDDPRSAEHDTACGPRVHALLRSGRRADLGSGRGGVARGRGRYSPSRTQQPAARPLGGLRPALAGA